jgi:small basic protein (TIGR04137 family)
MSLDRSLKSANSLIRHRNVLTRAERLDQLAEEEKWDEKKSVFGLPKVGHRKQAEAKAEKAEPGEAGAAAPAGGAAPAAGAAGAKTAAPAAKGGAPTAKAGAPAGKAAAAPAAKKK